MGDSGINSEQTQLVDDQDNVSPSKRGRTGNGQDSDGIPRIKILLSWRVLPWVIFVALLAAWLVWLFGTSVEFGDCIRKRKEYQAYNALHEEPFFIVKLFVRFHLNSVCTIHTANAFNGALTALAGVAVAAFTLALWRSTDKLWNAGERQIAIANISAQAASKAASAALIQAQGMVAAERSLYDCSTLPYALSRYVDGSRG